MTDAGSDDVVDATTRGQEVQIGRRNSSSGEHRDRDDRRKPQPRRAQSVEPRVRLWLCAVIGAAVAALMVAQSMAVGRLRSPN
jgi:hypothetical protein